MPLTLSEDDIISAVSSLPVFHQDDGPMPTSVPSAKNAMPFADDLPTPDPIKWGKADLGGNDHPPAPHRDDSPPAYKKSAADIAFDIIEKTLNSEVGQSALHAEIEKLGDSAAGVEICFRNVARGLEKTLEVVTTDHQKADMQRFKQTWDGHHKTYVKLLWQSRRVAGHARVIATDFAGDFLSVIREEKYSVAQKKKEIATYREELQRDRKSSQELSQGFLDLQSAVVEFQADLLQYAARTDELRKDVERLMKDIQELQVQLTKWTKATLLSAVVTLGLGAAAAGALAVGAICPPLWVGAAYGAFKTYKNGRECLNKYHKRREVSKDLNEKKEILAGHQRSLEGLEKISTILASVDSDIDFIQEKLGIFAQIWTFVHADLNEIEKQLDRASQTEIEDYFTKKIQAVSTVYKSLARALYWYETNVHIQKLHTLAQF
ncbi:hypothetical protein JVT61DRAFT_7073 [Boletus reticuloceps]|uniref:Uncharacterized protein n=1 Tax=Boletus reticuloceps TaxID=495285 RepID=A0A8I2YJK1_9AGAM|nr:hypothetical protein JVT61DRAFT_7073 [Boletus reticuloceps]